MSPLSNSHPELLAPAGGMEALRAAVANGADAVYLGVDRLNARRGAENFTIETLAEACRFAHTRGVRIYLTANVVVLPDEMTDALSLIDEAWAAGADAVIIQDLGLLRCVREALPHVRVHASTQMNAHSSRTINEIGRRGASRVTLARESSLDELAAWCRAAHEQGLEIESFAHGAICLSYSGQCLLSSLIGGRSANRGMCAQPCRLPYELLDREGAAVAAPGAHLLSPKDLAGIPVLPAMVEAGVDSLKIEGRMKSPEYVAVVAGVYRAALDRAIASPGAYEVRDGELSALSEAFSRGFTQAYLTGERGNEMMSYVRPNNRGVLVGRVASSADGEVTVHLSASLATDDTIEVWTGRGRFTQQVGEFTQEGIGQHVAPAGERVGIRVEQPVSAGDRVFRVRNASLSDAAGRTFQDPAGAPVPVSVAVRVVIGEPVRVTLTDVQGRSASSTGDVVEKARTREVSASDIMEHVGRFGGTAFSAEGWDVELSPGAGIGYSELHRVRREAVGALERVVLEPWLGRTLVRPQLPKPASAAAPHRPSPKPDRPKLVAAAASYRVAQACLEAGADSVHLPIDDLPAGAPPELTCVLSRISHDVDEDRQLSRLASGSTVVAGTLGLLAEASRRGHAVEAHWSLNALNAHAVAELGDMGAGVVWLSPELSSRQLAAVAAQAVVPVGFALAGHQEVMVTEHCILMAEGECDQACGSCQRRRSVRRLRDRKGYEFPLMTDRFGRSHLFNAVPLDLTGALSELLEAGVSALRVDVDTLEPAAAAAEVARARGALNAALAGRPVHKQADRSKVTSGHFFRGVS